MANRDRRKLAAWEAEGGVIAAYVPPDPVPEPVDRIADLEAAIAALKTANVLTDAMIDAEKEPAVIDAGIRAAGAPGSGAGAGERLRKA